jgi:hypothetical protein
MRVFDGLLSLFAIGVLLNPFMAEAAECPTGTHEKEVKQHCKLYDEPVFFLEEKFKDTKDKCICFFREAFQTVDIVKAYEVKADSMAADFSNISNQKDAGQANSSQNIVSDFSNQAQNHHGALAKSLEIQFAKLDKKFKDYFQSINQLHQTGQNNLAPEITCRTTPPSKVPALWMVSIAKKSLEDLQRIYIGRNKSNGMRSDLRKIHSEARQAEKTSGEMKAVTSARAFRVGELKDNDPSEMLNDPTLTMAPHLYTRGAGMAAGVATSAVAHGAKILPGAVGITAAGLTEYLVYHEIDTGTLLTIGMGAVTTLVAGTVPGIIVGGTIGVFHTAGRNSAIQKHEYSEFSKKEILGNRKITASQLSLSWGKAKEISCIARAN